MSEPPKKLLKWRRKLLKQKNQLVMRVGLSGRTMTVPNWAFKGPGDIYRGATGALLGTFPTALVYFLVYDRVSTAFKERAVEAAEAEKGAPPGATGRLDRLARSLTQAPEVRHLVSASAGALCSSVVRVPGDTVRHQTQAFMHRNVFAAFRTITAARGVGGLYLGFLPTLMRDIPELAVQFTLYELMRTATVRRHGEQAAASAAASGRRRGGEAEAKAYKPTTIEHLVMGGVAGASAAVFTMPLDFVKTRQQCGAVGGIVGLMKAVVAAEGVGGLFHGLVPRVGMAATTSAVFFGLFEGVKMVLKPASERSAVDADFVRKLTLKRCVRGRLLRAARCAVASHPLLASCQARANMEAPGVGAVVRRPHAKLRPGGPACKPCAAPQTRRLAPARVKFTCYTRACAARAAASIQAPRSKTYDACARKRNGCSNSIVLP